MIVPKNLLVALITGYNRGQQDFHTPDQRLWYRAGMDIRAEIDDEVNR